MIKKALGIFLFSAAAIVLVLSLKPAVETFNPPFGLPPIPWPEDNPYTQKKAELGRLLYFDKRLSSDNEISCASCHSIPKGFADQRAVSVGIFGHQGTRHAPTVINTAYLKLLFWDGRAKSLEEQCKGPISNPNEMTAAKDAREAHMECENRVKSIAGYRKLFKEVFGNDEVSIDDIAKAVATFERTVLSGNSPFDRYKAGDKTAMTAEQIEGYRVFNKAGCAFCHREPLFSDGNFYNIGVGMDAPKPDLGRYGITHNEKDWGAFKVPGLRDVAATHPYMHDGKYKTLEEVMDYYDKGGNPNKNLHRLMTPLHLSENNKKALTSFMHALSGEGWQHFKEPERFPE